MSDSNPTTHVLAVIDMSGSMAPVADDVRGGVNSYIGGLDADAGNYRVSVTLFDTEFIAHAKNVEPALVKPLDRHYYQPRGTTALLDAVGKTVTEFDAAHPDLPAGDKVALVIYTDGYENASREFTTKSVKKLLTDKQAAGWSVNYLAAGADTWTQAEALGVAASNYVNTSHTGAGTQASFRGLTRGTAAYSRTGDGVAVAAAVADEPDATA